MSNQQGLSPPKQQAKLELRSHGISRVNIETFSSYLNGPITEHNRSIKVNSIVSKKQKTINVTITFETEAFSEQTRLCVIKIEYSSVFRGVENPDIDTLLTFSRSNAPAIIFPMLRASLSMFTLGIGLPALVLPIINFVENPATVAEVD
jgi:preprotein translocase subunit SecB